MKNQKMIGTCLAGALLSALASFNAIPPEHGQYQLSQEGYEELLDFESCRLEPYQCVAGEWTDGVGNTVDVEPGKKITEKEAAADLKKNVARFEKTINQTVKVPINQTIFDAFVVFSFNVGEGAWRDSSALRILNQGDYLGACTWLLPWNKVTVIENGVKKKVVSEGLKRRRESEYSMCVKGVNQL